MCVCRVFVCCYVFVYAHMYRMGNFELAIAVSFVTADMMTWDVIAMKGVGCWHCTLPAERT